jgi:3-oxoadipate CoA-transferase alpha subunit
MISGFGGSGSPSNLTVINNNAGNCKIGLTVMIYAGMVKKNDLLFPKILRSPSLY